MGKMKVYELAKELNMSSKELAEKIKEMGIKIKTHLSAIEDEEVSKVRAKLGKSDSNSKKDKEDKKDNKKTGPVIIRRAVIMEDETPKTEEVKTNNVKREDVGSVEKRKNNDFNIVYREKPVKPLNLGELFGKKKDDKKKVEQEEKPKETIQENTLIKNEVEIETKKIEVKTEQQSQQKNEKKIENVSSSVQNKQPYKKTSTEDKKNESKTFNNKDNRNFNNSKNNNKNNSNNNNGNKNINNKDNNRNFGNKRDSRNNTSIENRKIEKNIKEIITSEVVQKENVKDFSKNNLKEKNKNKYDENRPKKQSSKFKGTDNYDIDSGKLKNLRQENKLSNMFDDSEGGMLDYYDLSSRKHKKNKKKNLNDVNKPSKQKIFELKEITIPESISVKDLAEAMKKTSSEVIKKLLGYGVMATLNNEIDFDTAFLVAGEFGITAHKQVVVTDEEKLFDESEDKAEDLVSRPPVVVVMGHVDHGKTSLLDAVRSTNVIASESGGITQHIGAYKVNINNREITFLDTPGHEAFTAMRARGAQVTDIAILVVAADDGIMPQTIEAINHAKAAEIPIVVAINKIDKEGANPDRIKQELTEYGLVPEEWGGDTICVPISAKKRINIDNLLEMVLLVADMQDLKVNPNKQAKGTVIEARLDKTRGPVATMLVQRGKLDLGDTVVVGTSIGRIRAMINDKGQRVRTAGPSTPVEIIGLTEVPEGGETFYEVKDEKTAKHLIERRKRNQREKALGYGNKVTLEDLFAHIEEGKLKTLNIIIKADVQGSVEAVKQALEKLTNEEVRVKVIHSSVGGVTETDVKLASVSNAIIIAFNVRPEVLAKAEAEKEGVEIKTYSVIYNAIEDITAAMNGMLAPKYEEVIKGMAEVRATFKISSIGTIAGCYVLDGVVSRNCGVRVIRDNVVIHEGKLESLKREKDDVKEVKAGYECGIKIEKFDDIKELDKIECFVMEEVKRK